MAKRLPSLKSIDGIQLNLEKLFREARRGDLEIADASKLAHILKIMFEMRATKDLEKRIEALEGEQ